MRGRVVDAVFDGLELAASFYDWVRGLRGVRKPKEVVEESAPLTHRSVEHQQSQIRSATQHPK